MPLNRDLVQRLLEAILALYAAGLKLPEVDPERDEHEGRMFDGTARQRFFRTVVDKLGGDFHYQLMFEPFDPDESKPVTAGLADDLSDIFFEMNEGLIRIPESGLVPANVIWGWAFGLETHWGRHAVSAIAALHSLLFGEQALG